MVSVRDDPAFIDLKTKSVTSTATSEIAEKTIPMQATSIAALKNDDTYEIMIDCVNISKCFESLLFSSKFPQESILLSLNIIVNCKIFFGKTNSYCEIKNEITVTQQEHIKQNNKIIFKIVLAEEKLTFTFN